MAILATQKVLTLDYWKSAANLQVGDYVFNQDGKLTRIKLVQPYHANDCFEVQFNDGLTMSGDKHLTFGVENKRDRIQLCEYKQVQKFKRDLRYYTAEYLSSNPLESKTKRKLYSIPTAKPLQLPAQDLPVPPFVFGFWFFNQRKNKRMCLPAGYEKVILQEFKNAGYTPTVHNKLGEFTVFPTVESHLVPNIPTSIPNNYLLSSHEQRIELLRGILYTKSRRYNKKNDTFRFSSKFYRTILQVQYLIESLGHRINVRNDTYCKQYTLFFKSKLKLTCYQQSPPFKVYYGRRYISKVIPIKPQLCVHIETDGENNAILAGEGFIACH
jgi:hypothetical protein